MQYSMPSPPLPMSTSSIDSKDAASQSAGECLRPSDLLAAFASIPDPRRPQGTRFALPCVLAMALVAILCHQLTILSIAQWAAQQSPQLLACLGLSAGKTPHQSTLQRLFKRLEPDEVSRALSAYLGTHSDASSPEHIPSRGSQAVAIDGKCQRGRLAYAGDDPSWPVHALSALLHEQGIVLAQEPIEAASCPLPDSPSPDSLVPDSLVPDSPASVEPDSPTQARPTASQKAQAELSVAPKLIARLDWHGRVLTGDALFCQRNICQQVVEAGGDYLLEVKENQPTLLEDIRLLFEPPPECALPLADCRQACTIEHGHGRYSDTRYLMASTDLQGYTDWPHLAQVFRLEHTWINHSQHKSQVHYGITSLPPEVAGPQRLLEVKRGHWQIENRLHYVKDVALGEDRSTIHLANGPSIMAMIRDLVISLLHNAGHHAITQRLRYYSWHPDQAAALVLGGSDQNA